MDDKIEEGQVWRKEGPYDWLRVDKIVAPNLHESARKIRVDSLNSLFLCCWIGNRDFTIALF